MTKFYQKDNLFMMRIENLGKVVVFIF